MDVWAYIKIIRFSSNLQDTQAKFQLLHFEIARKLDILKLVALIQHLILEASLLHQ